jgi:hypothetical protein
MKIIRRKFKNFKKTKKSKNSIPNKSPKKNLGTKHSDNNGGSSNIQRASRNWDNLEEFNVQEFLQVINADIIIKEASEESVTSSFKAIGINGGIQLTDSQKKTMQQIQNSAAFGRQKRLMQMMKLPAQM